MDWQEPNSGVRTARAAIGFVIPIEHQTRAMEHVG